MIYKAHELTGFLRFCPRNLNFYSAILPLVLIISLLTQSTLQAQHLEKPKVIILTDIGGDTDDEQSLSRFLHYADQFEILGLYATSRMGHGQDTKPDIIINQINAYEEVYPNLIKHSDDFPDPSTLYDLVKEGHGNHKVWGEGFDTEASNHLIETVDKTEGVVHIPIWGGIRELLQALWKVKNTRDENGLKKFSEKLQVHAIGDQDRHRDTLLRVFKDVRFIANGFAWLGFTGVRELSAFRGMYMTGDQSLQDAAWVKKHVHISPLGECYQLHGHGTDGMKEGDSPSFLGLINNGLNVPEKPDFGGWGGRYRILDNGIIIDVPDFLDGKMNERHSVSRWRPAFQRDFMARVRWGISSYEDANHPPLVKLAGHPDHLPIFIKEAENNTVVLDASSTEDPDGDHLSFRWWVYEEIYKPKKPVEFDLLENGRKVSFTMPNLRNNAQLHLILEVTDDGEPSLTRYRRIVLQHP